MRAHELPKNSTPKRKRVGRGDGSGRGKTAGRGMDGQNSRSGGGVRPGFEGGQNPLLKRIPKARGFKRPVQKPEIVHTDQLNRFEAGTEVTPQTLTAAGLTSRKAGANIKLLHRGELQVALTVKLPLASQSAQKAVEAAGGRLERTPES